MEKLKLSNKFQDYFWGCNVYNFRTIMDIHCKLLRLNKADFSLSKEKAEEIVRKDCNSFLKTKQGFHYLKMKYPNLSVSQAINEYIKKALWIDSIV